MIFLTGFMGSGKTTVGRALASRLGQEFVDLDERITEEIGGSIPEIFTYAGEKAFRFLESEALSSIAAREEKYVVATGGGLPVDPLNRTLMKSCGIIVHLRARFETLKKRVSDPSGRPLWNDDAQELFKARQIAYEDADIIIDTDEKTPHEVASEICSKIEGHPEPIPVILSDSAYPIYIGEGIFKDITSLIARHIKPEGIFVLIDANVLKLHRGAVEEALKGVPIHIMEVPPGEQSKSEAFVQTILAEMFSSQINREWICLGIGGGVTGDLAGFVSSIFMRGIPVVHAATTLLAQVDSAIGGKTAINNAFGKNLVGTFHQPLFVLSDVMFVRTLEDVQRKNAMAEVIKYGVIMDAELFDYIEKGGPLDYARLAAMCSWDKAVIVSKDEREGGLRRILNFGHTLGHVIEQISNYAVYHGQAVAAGMLFASWLSHKLGLLGAGDLERINGLIRREQLIAEDVRLPRVEELAGFMAMDKKASGGGIYFVLTPSIGNVTVKKLPDSEVLEAYKEFSHGF